jgi:hypothetical protein
MYIFKSTYFVISVYPHYKEFRIKFCMLARYTIDYVQICFQFLKKFRNMLFIYF